MNQKTSDRGSCGKQVAVFVTGGTGQIGCHLVARLVSCGFSVKVLSRKQDNPWSRIDNVRIIEGDILDQDTISEAVRGCDYLFHLAVYQNISDRRKDLFQRVNVEGTKTILDCSIKSDVKKVVYVSTAMVFEPTGKLERGEGWSRKDSCPHDNYLQTKIEALALVRQMKNILPIVVVYPTTVIDLENLSTSAPVQSRGLQMFIWDKIGGGIPGGILNLIGTKNRVLNYVIVEDLVEGMILAATAGRPGEEYILGGQNITAGNYLSAVSHRVKRNTLPFRIPIFPFKILSTFGRFLPIPPVVYLISDGCLTDMCFSSEKARGDLGYRTTLKL
jgi:nucleoside-diphosphate-sugar epimerase